MCIAVIEAFWFRCDFHILTIINFILVYCVINFALSLEPKGSKAVIICQEEGNRHKRCDALLLQSPEIFPSGWLCLCQPVYLLVMDGIFQFKPSKIGRPCKS